jgi:hypothetical protein
MRTFAGHRGFTSIFNCSIASLFILAVPRSTLGQDISITDFRIPTSKYQKFVGGLSGEWGKTSNSYLYPSSISQGSNSTLASNLQTSFNYDLADLSEVHSLETTLMLAGQGTYNKGTNTWINQTDTSLSEQSQKSYRLDVAALSRYSSYITPDALHWFVEASATYFFDQIEGNADQNSTMTKYHNASFGKDNDWNASIGGGIGYGKLRDGSPVFAILRILEKLQEDSLLVRPLTKDEIINLVEILARRTEYAQIHDRYIKYLMGDLFSELQRIGVLKDNVPTAFSVERAVEVLSEQIEPRLFGWRTRIGVQRTYNEESIIGNGYGLSTSYVWNFHDFLQLAVDYGYPVSLNLHLTSSISVGIPKIDYQRKINSNFNVKGIYQVGERIDATISGSMQRIQYVNGDLEDEFTRSFQYNAGVSFRFFIENQVSFTISALYVKTQQDLYFPSSRSNNVTEGPRIDFNLSYRFF